MKPPCDEAVIRSSEAESPCAAKARVWVLVATIAGSSMAFIDSTVVNVALPALQASFHATVVDVQWVVESYGLLLAALILVGGSLGDIFGRRLIFLLGVVIFALASAGCGVAASIAATDLCEKHSGRWCCAAGARQPRDHQYQLRRGEPRQSDWHMVRFHGNDHGAGSSSRRLAH